VHEITLGYNTISRPTLGIFYDRQFRHAGCLNSVDVLQAATAYRRTCRLHGERKIHRPS